MKVIFSRFALEHHALEHYVRENTLFVWACHKVEVRSDTSRCRVCKMTRSYLFSSAKRELSISVTFKWYCCEWGHNRVTRVSPLSKWIRKEIFSRFALEHHVRKIEDKSEVLVWSLDDEVDEVYALHTRHTIIAILVLQWTSVAMSARPSRRLRIFSFFLLLFLSSLVVERLLSSSGMGVSISPFGFLRGDILRGDIFLITIGDSFWICLCSSSK